MFPTPIARTSPWVQRSYKVLLPLALIVWLLPLIGIAVTSIRPSSDLAAGNYFGMPSSFAGIENYTAVFKNSNIGYYILNSFRVTIPTVIGAVALLIWQATAAPSQDWAVSVRLTQNGQEIAQLDREHPVSGAYPTSRWTPGEVVADAYPFALPPGAAPDGIKVVVYRKLADGGFVNLDVASFLLRSR